MFGFLMGDTRVWLWVHVLKQFTSVWLLSFGRLMFRLLSLPIPISWKDDMPGVFQEVIIFPFLQLSEKL